MIDGVKIWCVGTSWRRWYDNPDLNFIKYFVANTGEVPVQTTVARYKGLKFKIAPSKKEGEQPHCFIEGSLHKFWNDGNGNANNFSLSDIEKVVAILQKDFGVFPDKAIIQNLEFGVNVPLSIPANAFVSNIISMPDKAFTAMDLKRPLLGAVCIRYEYGVKIYDKLLQQDGLKNRHLLRVEMFVKKARYLEKFGLITLSNICCGENLAKVGRHLLDTFDKVIYYDGSIDEDDLTAFEIDKLLRFQIPRNWENSKLTKLQRHRQRKSFNRMMEMYGANEVKDSAYMKMKKIWQNLNVVSTKKGGDFTDILGKGDANKNDNLFTDLNPKVDADKMITFSQLEYRVKRLSNGGAKRGLQGGKKPSLKNNDLRIKQNPKMKDAKCLTCGRDISHQKTGSKFCTSDRLGKPSRKCRSKDFSKRRRERKQAQRKKEETQLAALLPLLPSVKLHLLIFFHSGGSHSAVSDALRVLPLPLRSVARVAVASENLNFELTTRRAKKLITAILAMNELEI